MARQRVAALAAVDGERLRDQMRQMKEYVLRHLPDLLEQFEENVTANGAQVYWAKEADEANRTLIEIAAQGQRAEGGQGQDDDDRGNARQRRVGAGGHDGGRDGPGRVHHPTGRRAAQAHRRARHPQPRRGHRPALSEKLDMPPTLDPEVMCGVARTAAPRVSRRRHGHQRLQLWHRRDRHGLPRHQRGQRAHGVHAAAASMCVVMGIEKLVPTVEDAFLQYQALHAQFHRPTVQRLSLHDQRPAQTRRCRRPGRVSRRFCWTTGAATCWPTAMARRSCAFALRRVSQRLPGLRGDRRPRLWQHLQRADWRGHQRRCCRRTSPTSRTAPRQRALRRVPRRLPGQD